MEHVRLHLNQATYDYRVEIWRFLQCFIFGLCRGTSQTCHGGYVVCSVRLLTGLFSSYELIFIRYRGEFGHYPGLKV